MITISGWITLPFYAGYRWVGYPVYHLGRRSVTAAARNPLTSRRTALLTDLADDLSRLSDPRRLAARQELRLRRRYEDLAAARGAFTRLLGAAAGARTRDLDALPIPSWPFPVGCSRDTGRDRPSRELAAVDHELFMAAQQLSDASGRHPRRRNARTSALRLLVAKHHLNNVFGRSGGGLAAMERAVNDFTGADLSTATVETDPWRMGVQLGGLRWDETTRWPAGAVERIRAASTPSGDGHVVSGATAR